MLILGIHIYLGLSKNEEEFYTGNIYVKQIENGEEKSILPNGNLLRNGDMSNIKKNIINT